MSGLFVTGTDTGIGKTEITAALARMFRRRGLKVGVMKPITTGCCRLGGRLISDDAEKLQHAAGTRDPVKLVCPYRFEPPLAPAAMGMKRVPGLRPGTLFKPRTISFDRIEQAFQELARRYDVVLVEGIGGLLVPLDARRTVADLARRLGLPVVIVARAGLGTLNHTLLTVEAARSAGLQVAGVVLNSRSRRPSLAEKTNPAVFKKIGIPLLGIVPWMRHPSPERIADYLKPVILSLSKDDRNKNHRRLSRIDRSRIWHPFTQMADWEKSDPLIVESGDGVFLTDTRGRRYLDGVSSLWVNLHGHAHPALNRALREQAGRIAHSTLLGCANVPSIELAEELIRIAPRGLTRVFYSDNGSTAVEVALKMAFQYWQQNGAPRRRRFVHFVNGYHGDTIGSVSVGGIDLFHHVYSPLLFKGFKVPVEKSLQALRRVFKEHGSEVAGVVVEPLIQGASGMITQPPGWLKQVERICRRAGTFLIADEVAVGFGRTGTMFACEQEKVRPDFLCVAKGLSGGYLPLAATLATEKVYKGFKGSYASLRTFFHGHSYTGNPLGCAVALENLRLFRREKTLQKLQPKIRLFTKELARFRDLPHVGEVRQRGLMAGIELVRGKAVGVQVCQLLRRRGILLRPLGNVIVLLPPLAISEEELRRLCRETARAIREVVYSL